MKVVVVHIFAQSFGHCSVALIGVHHSGEDILLTTYDLHGSFVGIGIKLFRKFIAAVIVEISGVHIKDNSPYLTASGFRPLVEITPSCSICSNIFT